jgi:uncharacterized repeat protein (TIGR02543 family)
MFSNKHFLLATDMLNKVESPDRRTFEEKMADFFSNPVVWIVIGCIIAAIIIAVVVYKCVMNYKETQFTISLYDEGVITNIIVKRNDRPVLPFPQRKGYRFGGWFIDSAMMTPFVPTEKITYNRMLYAKWVKEAD